MDKVTFIALTLTVMAYANIGYAVPRVPVPEAPRRMNIDVPKPAELLICGSVTGVDSVLREVTALPNVFTLRGTLSERAPSLTLFRFGGPRGVELVTPSPNPADWVPCRPQATK